MCVVRTAMDFNSGTVMSDAAAKSKLHITSGDCAGSILVKSGIAGEVFVWHDVLYEGPRKPGWPDEEILAARSLFLEEVTGGGLERDSILKTLNSQYDTLLSAKKYEGIVLWFDACLFDQAMLAHILACLHHLRLGRAELLCIDAFPGIEPFNGLGQLTPNQMASLYDLRKTVTAKQFKFASTVDRAFAVQDKELLTALARLQSAPLPWVPAAAARWILEQPDPDTGLGRLESLVMHAVHNGLMKPWDIFSAVASADTPPQYWGDITLWAKINGLAERQPPLVKISGPASRLPQWEGGAELNHFRVTALQESAGGI